MRAKAVRPVKLLTALIVLVALAREASSQASEPASPRVLVAAPDFSYWGRVVGADDGAPIAGARIRWLDVASNVSRTTDADGLFHIDEAPLGGGIARIDAHGRGPCLARIGRGHSTAASAEIIELSRAGTLDVQVLDARGKSRRGVRVSVSDATMALGRLPDGRIHHPEEFVWWADTDAAGKCSIEDIAPHIPLTLVVRSNRRELYKIEKLLELAPGQRCAWTCDVKGVRVSGVLLDQDDRPVGCHEVWLRSDALYGESQSIGRYFDFAAGSSIAQKCSTDDTGAFAFESVPGGSWWVGPAPTRTELGRPLSPIAVCPVATGLVIDENAATSEVVLRAHRGLYVRGRVIQPDGGAVANARVCASCEDPEGGACADAFIDGTFALGPFAPGELRIAAYGKHGFSDSEQVVAHAGDQDVVLTLSLGASMRLQAVDAQDGKRCYASFSARVRETPDHAKAVQRIALSSRTQPTELDDLVPGIYDICARSHDDLIGVARNVALIGGAAPAEITVQMEPAAMLCVALYGREQTLEFEVESDGAIVFSDRIATGERKPAVVPAGVLTVRLKSGARVLAEQTVDTRSNEPVRRAVGVSFHRD